MVGRGSSLSYRHGVTEATLAALPSEVAAGQRLTIITAHERYGFGGAPDGSYIGFKRLFQDEAAILVPTKGTSDGLQYLGDTQSVISGTAIKA